MYCDYPKALNLETTFLLDKRIPFETSSIYFLLYEINKLINNVNRLKENNIEVGLSNPALNN